MANRSMAAKFDRSKRETIALAQSEYSKLAYLTKAGDYQDLVAAFTGLIKKIPAGHTASKDGRAYAAGARLKTEDCLFHWVNG